MSGHSVVVVESPAKAKTINKYLGKDYTVLASYGHVRDLPPKDGSVRPDENFAMSWELGERAGKPLSEIKKALKGASNLYLATDPDREGEAISWHLEELLKSTPVLKGVKVQRVAFNEITKSAIRDAFDNPRAVDQSLVEAYLARRALDYLVGFTISPVLWRKLPGSRSAGRVQSVALRLICERESEIEKFISEEYWTIGARLKTKDGVPFFARLTHLSGNKLGKFDIANEHDAKAAAKRIEAKTLKVTNIEAKQAKRHPYAPFITSTLQQEASRKLGFSASETMRTAQRLYEGVEIGGETVGLITYMRTDGTTLSGEAIAQIRNTVREIYGDKYIPESPRVYKSKARNAQEAHEAIRPTNVHRTPEQVAKYLGPAETKLYDLIWKRAMACQMESAVLDQTAVDISDGTDDVVLRATGSVVTFDGFLKLYEESRDDSTPDENGEDARLPAMKQSDAIGIGEVKPEQHFTQPPPRYSEASLVKKLEEEGIGRPSTYASILQVLQDRNYVRLEQKRFIPEDRGRIVTTFLTKYFTKYVDYKFTADLEEELDAIAEGALEWKRALRDFWEDFSKAVAETKDLTITQVIDALDEELGPHFFPPRADKKDPRLCPACGSGRLGLRLGRNGAFIGCSNYQSEPKCSYTTPLVITDGEGLTGLEAGPRELGPDQQTGKMVTLRRGPYGVYVQLGEANPEDKKDKPRRQGLPKGLSPDQVTLQVALDLLALPRTVGMHPESGEKILAGIGRFGPYLKHGDTFKSIPAGDDVLTVGINRAVELLSQARQRGGRGSAGKLKDLGEHPQEKQPIELYSGKYGPYVKMGRINATLPRESDPASFTLEEAIILIDKKAASGGKGKKTKAAPKRKAEKSAARPKKAAKTKAK